MSTDEMRGVTFGICASGFVKAVSDHSMLWSTVWLVWGAVVYARSRCMFGHRLANDPVSNPFSARMHVCTRCHRIIA